MPMFIGIVCRIVLVILITLSSARVHGQQASNTRFITALGLVFGSIRV